MVDAPLLRVVSAEIYLVLVCIHTSHKNHDL